VSAAGQKRSAGGQKQAPSGAFPRAYRARRSAGSRTGRAARRAHVTLAEVAAPQAPRTVSEGLFSPRRGGRAVEGARLESVFTGNCNVGSNPTLSAIPGRIRGRIPP